jgi:hypothetical protein
MSRARLALFAALGSIAGVAAAQSVISTHSGLIYFFDGSVYLGEQQLQQKFGRFPDMGERNELRTEHGRAEILLTPGVFLRIGENSSVRMMSARFGDTRVEFLGGTAILEATEPAHDTSVTLVHKNWQLRLPREGVYRIESQPAQVIVYKGSAEVSTAGTPEKVSVHQGQTLALASVLTPKEAATAASDDFKGWAMSRSQAVSSDNSTAASILDDPSEFELSLGSLGSLDGLAALRGLSYFPMTGIPGVTATNPYGLSFWSPYQSSLGSVYFPPHTYGSLYPTGWPGSVYGYPWSTLRTLSPSTIGVGSRPIGIAPIHRTPPSSVTSRPGAPRLGIHPGLRR